MQAQKPLKKGELIPKCPQNVDKIIFLPCILGQNMEEATGEAQVLSNFWWQSA